jgi:hypothetical protein
MPEEEISRTREPLVRVDTGKVVDHWRSSVLPWGHVIAMAISWVKVKSVWWLIYHGLLGWGYVIYHLIMRDIHP